MGSKKRRQRKAEARTAKEETQARRVVTGVIIAIVVLGVAMIALMTML